MDNKQKIVLNSERSKENVDEILRLKQEVVSTSRALPIQEINSTLNVSELFKNERDTSSCYRFLGNINVVASNILFNWDGENSFQNVLVARDFDPQTQEYVNEIDDVLFEDDGWFYYLTGETTCDRIYLQPNQPSFGVLNPSGDTNWSIEVTYPAEVNLSPLVFNGVNISEGVALYSGTTVEVDERQMTAFICSINHGLNVGDRVKIQSDTSTGFEGEFDVYALGFGDGTYEDNTFVVDFTNTIPSFIGTNTRFKKVVGGVESKYYSRWFKPITKISQLETHKTAFATNIYTDQIYSYQFNEGYTIDDNLTDYLGRPLTTVYLTVKKKQDYSDGTPFWTPVESGINTKLVESEYDINTINTTSANDSIESDVNNSSGYIFGDIVEFNEVTQIETILEEAHHRFNTLNREDNNFLEGYYYKAHYPKNIRLFSDYVDEGFSGETSAPNYASILQDGRARWRDVLPNNFSNGESIPFLNGCHYVYQNVNILVKRQDPCGLYPQENRSIIVGDCDTNEQFEQTDIIEVCR